MIQSHLIFLLIVITGMFTSYRLRKLTLIAALTGGALATLMYFTSGWIGIVIMGLFFILGTAATSLNHKKKETLQLAEKNHGQRNASQVLANAGVAGILSLILLFYPDHKELIVMLMSASFSSAAADTISSEMGSIYGKRFYNILTLKKDKRGLDGVISMEGCVFGLAGSMIIATTYALFKNWDMNALIIVIAGTLGNLFDSVLGAAYERKGKLKNDTVNFLNTLFGAFAGYVLWMIFLSD